MNVVKRDKHVNAKTTNRSKNELVRKDSSIGIRGAALLPVLTYSSNVSRPTNNVPKYQFNRDESSTAKKSSMGPPLGPPRSAKRKIIQNSNSTRPESSSSGPRPRILASDTAADTSADFHTPRNRPGALRYISSSSRGGYSGRSGRSTSTSAVEASVILAISEGRGMARGEIGMAAVDLRHPHLVLCQFSDTLLYTHTLTKINYFNPIEVSIKCGTEFVMWGPGMARGEIGMTAVDLRHPHLVLCQFSDTLLYTHTLTKINYFNPIEVNMNCGAEFVMWGPGMARGEIGMAAVDLRHPHLVLCQFSDTLLYTHTLTKINYFNPIELIVPHTFCEGIQPNQLYQLIKDQYPLVKLTTVQRRHFNDAAGRQQIQSLCAPQYSGVSLQVFNKFYAVTAAAAVLKYVENIQCIVFARESLKIEYHSSENTMVIDVGTATQLELVQPLVSSAGQSCCLLGVLGPTYTIGGIRALRAAILQPSCNKEFIEGRLDAVQDLIENDNGLMSGLQDVIKKLADVDKILLLCMESQNQNMDKVGEAQLNQTLLLKTTMEMVPKLVEALTAAESGRLRKIKMDFENPHYNEIADRIKNVIQDDAHLEKGAMGSLQRCFAVKPDINGLLDVARRTYSELIEDIQKIVEQLSETYDLPVRLNQNVMKGFHIVLPIAPKNRRSFSVESLPPIFIQVHNSGASASMTTEELVVLDQQAKESLNEIQKMSNVVVASLLKEIRPFMSSLYTLCENVAELDVLLAMAQSSSVGSYIRPEFGSYLDIRNSVHPLLDYNSHVMPVPNDIFASPEHNFTIITGPNMGGKSIYIKQIAVMQIMAQLGCFLPATNAVLRLCDRIFSRIGFNDSVELNASTYVVEMKEMQHIMTGLTKSSLVIIDELCRGTSAEEGTSIAWAICEELMMSDAFVFFTTHFLYLTRLQDLYFNVLNRHTTVTEEEVSGTQNPQKRLVYQHKIDMGTTKTEHYGLALAEKTNLPDDTVKLARELAELIAKDRKPQEINTPEINDDRILYQLNANIRQESRKHVNANDIIKHMLRKFKDEHPDLMERLKLQGNRGNGLTDNSANYSSETNSKKNESENVNERHSASNGSNYTVNNLTPMNRRQNIICSTSDTDSENLAKKSLNAPKVHTIPKNNPKAIYSTSNGTERSDEMKKNNNYACVRSSNELLTTLMNVDSDDENIGNAIQNVSLDKCNRSLNSPEREFSTDNIEEIAAENNSVDNNHDHSIISNSSTSNHHEIQSIVTKPAIIKNNENFDSSDSDIADALTQVIEECSVYEDTSDSDKCSDLMSADEELMMETVNEINKELEMQEISIESIVLTPPFGFRDE